MTSKIYVVYTDRAEDPRATCNTREVACQVAEYLEQETGAVHWVADITISETLEEFKEAYQ